MSLQALIDGGLPANGPLRLAATDIAGYLRLEQCERFLKLQLHRRNFGDGFLTEFDVAPQALPALLTGSGAGFEESVIVQIRDRMPLTNFALDRRRVNDNAQVMQAIAGLGAGETIALTQPRLHVPVDGWDLRGDLDLLILSRSEDGILNAIVLDMKSSSASRIEHRVQIALYAVMVRHLCAMNGIEPPATRIGIVYRGARDPESLSDTERERQERHRLAARDFGLNGPLLDLAANDVLFQDAVDDLVLGRRSVARSVAAKALHETTFAFAAKCDGCFFNEFCLKSSNEQDDLSLIPFMGVDAKTALQRSGITSTEALATLKMPAVIDIAGVERRMLAPAPGKEAICHDLGDHRAVAGRLDELVARARKYRKLADARFEERHDLPSAGYGTLPYCDPEHDPNLIRIYIDVQRDYLNERVYLAGALVQASDQGVTDPARRRTILEMTESSPVDAEIERLMLMRFIRNVLQAISAVAAPDANGEMKAPIHLVFYESGAMKALLEALGRHAEQVLGATALYDFITQLAAFDSPLVTVLSEEIRALKNYPILAPSLHAVARYLGFDWNDERPLTTLFRSQVFDDVRPVEEDGDAWFTGRSRFSSNLPLEYAYNAWGELPPLKDDSLSERASYRTVDRDDLLAFARRRLEAMEIIAADFRGNDRTSKTAFALPDLGAFEERAHSIGMGLEEFVLTEQHVAISGWRHARQPAPEQRMLDGVSLVVRYLEADQDPGVAEANRKHKIRARRYDELRAAYFEANPEAEKFIRSKEERAESDWSHAGTRFHLLLEHPGGVERIDHLLGLSDIKIGDRVVIGERWSVDGRLPEEQQTRFQTTAKQLLYGDRATLIDFKRELNDAGEVTRVLVTLEMVSSFGNDPGFVFFARQQPFTDGEIYTLETDPSNMMLSWGRKAALGLQEGAINALADRLAGEVTPVNWPVEAANGQARFLDGMNAFTAEGDLHEFEPQKHRYIGSLGDAPTLLVQGPPGTGKSYTTAFAIWARVQGAMAAGMPFRVLIACKTHAATDVLLKNVADVQEDLKRFRRRKPELFDRYLDARLLDVPVFRYSPKTEPSHGIRGLYDSKHPSMEGQKAVNVVSRQEYAVAGMTPGGGWKLAGETKDRFGTRFINLVVLDEASQMNLPEAVMATVSMELDGQLIVVGDHRQMPPIVQHDWVNEARRSFKAFAAYESLYLALDRLVLDDQKIKFSESFRLHRDMAEFLKREIYHQDGIDFFSRKTAHLEEKPNGDAFADAVLGPEPLVVIAHDETASQTSNAFEQLLIDRLVQGLDETFEAAEGLGVVVPHRAQRAALRDAIDRLSVRDAATGAITLSSVDTVERFQGDERTVIVVSLTESDPHFIRTTSEFLLDPRRLTVALSRAKQKMIVIASRSVFGVIAADEDTFVNAGLWKNLLRRTCTDTRWSGSIEGHEVEVRVNPPLVN